MGSFGNLDGASVLILLALQMSMGARLGTKEIMVAIVKLDIWELSAIGIWISPSMSSRDDFIIIFCSNICQASREHYLAFLDFCGTVGKNSLTRPLVSQKYLVMLSLRFSL